MPTKIESKFQSEDKETSFTHKAYAKKYGKITQLTDSELIEHKNLDVLIYLLQKSPHRKTLRAQITQEQIIEQYLTKPVLALGHESDEAYKKRCAVVQRNCRLLIADDLNGQELERKFVTRDFRKFLFNSPIHSEAAIKAMMQNLGQQVDGEQKDDNRIKAQQADFNLLVKFVLRDEDRRKAFFNETNKDKFQALLEGGNQGFGIDDDQAALLRKAFIDTLISPDPIKRKDWISRSGRRNFIYSTSVIETIFAACNMQGDSKAYDALHFFLRDEERKLAFFASGLREDAFKGDALIKNDSQREKAAYNLRSLIVSANHNLSEALSINQHLELFEQDLQQDDIIQVSLMLYQSFKSYWQKWWERFISVRHKDQPTAVSNVKAKDYVMPLFSQYITRLEKDNTRLVEKNLAIETRFKELADLNVVLKKGNNELQKQLVENEDEYGRSLQREKQKFFDTLDEMSKKMSEIPSLPDGEEEKGDLNTTRVTAKSYHLDRLIRGLTRYNANLITDHQAQIDELRNDFTRQLDENRSLADEEIRSLQAKILRLGQGAEADKEIIVSLRKELFSLKNEHLKLSSTAQNGALSLTDTIEKFKASAALDQNTIQANKEAIDEHKKSAALDQGTITELRFKIKEVEIQVKSYQEMIKDLTDANDVLNVRVMQAEEQVGLYSASEEKSTVQIQSQQQDILKLNLRKKDLESRLTQFSTELDQAKRELKVLNKQISDRDLLIFELKCELTAANKTNEVMQSSFANPTDQDQEPVSPTADEILNLAEVDINPVVDSTGENILHVSQVQQDSSHASKQEDDLLHISQVSAARTNTTQQDNDILRLSEVQNVGNRNGSNIGILPTFGSPTASGIAQRTSFSPIYKELNESGFQPSSPVYNQDFNQTLNNVSLDLDNVLGDLNGTNGYMEPQTHTTSPSASSRSVSVVTSPVQSVLSTSVTSSSAAFRPSQSSTTESLRTLSVPPLPVPSRVSLSSPSTDSVPSPVVASSALAPPVSNATQPRKVTKLVNGEQSNGESKQLSVVSTTSNGTGSNNQKEFKSGIPAPNKGGTLFSRLTGKGDKKGNGAESRRVSPPPGGVGREENNAAARGRGGRVSGGVPPTRGRGGHAG